MSTTIKENLTTFKPGSVRETWKIAFPLMVSNASMGMMLFFDRLILAQYSLEAMNAVTSVTMTIVVFQLALTSLVSAAEIFVGQYNGAGQYNKIGNVTWQMLWLCLFSSIIFIPLGVYGGDFFVPAIHFGHGHPYFMTLVLFAPLFGGVASLCSFFVGIGRTSTITCIALIGNVINVLLDLILVFGIPNVLSPLGTTGAALASGISIIIQCCIFFGIFLSQENKKFFLTRQWTFNIELFFKQVKLGFPQSMNHVLEMGAWATLLYLIALQGEKHLSVASIAQSFLMLFAFYGDGLTKGVKALASNYIGAMRNNILRPMILSNVILILIFSTLLTVPLFLFPSICVSIFVGKQESLIYQYIEDFKISLFCIWMFILFDGISWTIAGVLESLGDTKFVTYINCFNIWGMCVLPAYLMFRLDTGSPSSIWILAALYSLLNIIIFWYRFRSIESKKQTSLFFA